MLIIISEKDFKKNAEKLVEKKDYLIFDATEDTSANFTKYANVVSMSGFNPPRKLVKARSSKGESAFGLDTDDLDEDKVKKIEKKFFKGKSFVSSLMASIKTISDDDRNIFIVFTNKVYKAYGKRLQKAMEKFVDVDFDFVCRYDDVKEDKKLLKKSLKDDAVKKLHKIVKKYEENLGK